MRKYYYVVENAKTVEKQIAQKYNKLDAYKKYGQYIAMKLLEITKLLYLFTVFLCSNKTNKKHKVSKVRQT